MTQIAEKNAITYVNVDAEKSVLGAILQGSEDALNDLTERDFYRPEHRSIFRAAQELRREGQAIHLMTLGNRLAERQELETIGDAAYLLECFRCVPTLANSRSYIGIRAGMHPAEGTAANAADRRGKYRPAECRSGSR